MFKAKLIIYLILFLLFFINKTYSDTINEIVVTGNERIPNETILIFSNVKIGDNLEKNKLNKIINSLYDTKFFENVSSKFENNILTISVVENPLIGSINLNGIKSKSLKAKVQKVLTLKPRASYNEFDLENDRRKLVNFLKKNSYYHPSIQIFKEFKSDNIIDIIYEINLGSKSKIKKSRLQVIKFLKITNSSLL